MYKRIFVICGNDGTGKSSVVNAINSKYTDYFAVERSNNPLDIPADFFDKLTLQYTFGDRSNVDLPTTYESMELIWVILDADIDEIECRMKSREKLDAFETTKSLCYFRKRFRELSAFYGVPLIDTTKLTLEQVVNTVVDSQKWYSDVRVFKLQNFDLNTLRMHSIEEYIWDSLRDARGVYLAENLPDIDTRLTPDVISNELRQKMTVRYILNNSRYDVNGQPMMVSGEYRFKNHVYDWFITPERHNGSMLRLVDEGESKQVYKFITNNPYLKDLAIIVLKPTIYSHSMQATGELEGLSEVRAMGTKIFLEMMWRNRINHTYRCINEHGVICSDFLNFVPETEIVVKKYCEGTDKHSYYQMQKNNNMVTSDGQYKFGPYVRFDWRNPNHIFTDTGRSPTENMYYYVIEHYLGKEKFFKDILTNNDNLKPFGDRSLSEDMLSGVINTVNTRKSVLKMFYTIQYYFNKVDLEIQDVCFMLDASGNTIWSEVNEDCMRIKSKSDKQDYDKDIWRAGGSRSKDLVIKKWKLFNDIMVEYFNKNKFIDGEMLEYNIYPYQLEIKKMLNNCDIELPSLYKHIYDEMIRNNIRRRVILTLDMYNTHPVLVKSGKVSEIHTNGNVNDAIDVISLYPDVLVVDLNGALGEKADIDDNRPIIKRLAREYYIHTGGGLRSIEDVQEMLSSSVRRVVVSSNTDTEFISKIPKERLIVELSVNEHNEVMTHGRKVNTGINIDKYMNNLAAIGVNIISITFHCSEGHLQGIPKKQIADIIKMVPRSITKVIIAGGISSIDDLQYLWSFDKIIPQLGSAIWKNKITMGDLYSEMVKFGPDGLVPAVIQDIHGQVKGHIYMNREALCLTCQHRILYKYSRKYVKVMLACDNYSDKVKQISVDCDGDSLLITVGTQYPFCHTKNYSCYSLQTSIKANLLSLNDNIKTTMGSTSYTGVMQANPGLSLAKLMEEFWEIMCASNNMQTSECSDFVVHMLMYMNGMGISLESIMNELNARRWDPRLIKFDKPLVDKSKIIMGITSAKYSNKTDLFALEELGFLIKRPTGRELTVSYVITDQEAYKKYFGDKTVEIVMARPKDMPWLMAFRRLDCLITYNTVIENYPPTYKIGLEVPDNDLQLCLIRRANDNINYKSYNANNKLMIACEHPRHVVNHLKNVINEEYISFDKIVGSSESYLVNTTKVRYDLCDAIVETGKTLEKNNLCIHNVVLDHGDVKIGLYWDIRL